MAEHKYESQEEMERIGLTGDCAFCGERAKYFWVQGIKLEFCQDCALNLFPRMLADLTCIDYDEIGGRFSPRKILDKVEKRYWEAIASKFRSDWVRKNHIEPSRSGEKTLGHQWKI